MKIPTIKTVGGATAVVYGGESRSLFAALRERFNGGARLGTPAGTKAPGATIVTSAQALAGATGRIILVGPEVSASLGEAVPDSRWQFQPPRELRKWQPLQPKSSQFLNITIHRRMVEALKSKRFGDVRLGYDGYRRWLLQRPNDTVLIGGVKSQEGLWVTEIAYINKNIVSIRERRIKMGADIDQRYQIQQVIADARNANPRAAIVLSVEGMQADPAWKVETVGQEPLLSAPAASLSLGHLNLNLKLAMPPLLVAAASVGFALFTLNQGRSDMRDLSNKYRAAVSGIENEYKEGMKLINVLEARNVYMGERERKVRLEGRAAKILQALPKENSPLLEKLTVSRSNEGVLSYEMTINVIPDKDIDPIRQGEPYLQGLATGLQSAMGMPIYNDVILNGISNRLKFRQMVFTGVLPNNEVELP